MERQRSQYYIYIYKHADVYIHFDADLSRGCVPRVIQYSMFIFPESLAEGMLCGVN